MAPRSVLALGVASDRKARADSASCQVSLPTRTAPLASHRVQGLFWDFGFSSLLIDETLRFLPPRTLFRFSHINSSPSLLVTRVDAARLTVAKAVRPSQEGKDVPSHEWS